MKNNSEKNKSVPATPHFAWVIFIVVFLASVVAPLNQMKVTPLLPVIMEYFQLPLGEAGWLNSVFSLTGLFLALPTGIFLRRLGPKLLGIISLACMTVGSALGALSPTPGLLIFSRIIEGTGLGLISVVGPAVIAMWFPPENRGTPMGIWATWFPVGCVLMYVFAPPMAEKLGWQSVWWLGASLSFLILIVYALIMRLPPSIERSSPKEVQSSIFSELKSMMKFLNNKTIWMLGLGLALFSLTTMAIGTYYPTFLNEERGYTLSQASLISSIALFLILFTAPLAGALSDRIGSRRLLFSLPIIVMMLTMPFPFRIYGWWIIVLMTVIGFIGGAVPTATFAAAPEIMKKPELAGLGLAVVMAGSNLGMMVGPILFGNLVEWLGWIAAGYCLIPIGILDFFIMWRIKVR